jgi:NAD(P)-dependent dehydrogenase (short-subunit alcohol dehydrogenase family)
MTDLSNLYGMIKNKFGHLDIVFANAGCGEVAPFELVSEEFYDRHFDNNVKGMFFTVQKALPLSQPDAAVAAGNKRNLSQQFCHESPWPMSHRVGSLPLQLTPIFGG